MRERRSRRAEADGRPYVTRSPRKRRTIRANGTGKIGGRKESTSRVEEAIPKPSRWRFRRLRF
jgi:hypothetical protein